MQADLKSCVAALASKEACVAGHPVHPLAICKNQRCRYLQERCWRVAATGPAGRRGGVAGGSCCGHALSASKPNGSIPRPACLRIASLLAVH